MGRKNILFAGNDSGGERWAILASLINTAKLHEIDPQTYLADVLDRIVSGRTKVNALHEAVALGVEGGASSADRCRRLMTGRSGAALVRRNGR